MQIRLIEYLNEYDFITIDQSPYRKCRSTVTCLHTTIDELLQNGEDGLVTGVVFLDISKCFATIDHNILKELGTSRTHSAVIRCLTICQHIPVVKKNHKNELTQQFDIICCLARCLALFIESKQIMSLLSCESATLKRGPQLCGQRCGPYLRY